jgi:hypothetical protein
MADLALNDSLIDEYLKYKIGGEFDTNKMRKLLKYIQPFFLKNTHKSMSDPAMPMQLSNDPLIEIIDIDNDEALVQKTILKLMLTDKYITVNYKILNIDNTLEKLKPKYGATYPNSIGKTEAIEHIKFLLSDAKWIKITDGYIATSASWEDNKSLLEQIIPNIAIDLTIVGADKNTSNFVIDQTKKDEINSLIPNLSNVKATRLNQNIHDRYIETDKLKILLSSGFEHLNQSSSKDFTYIVEIK